MSSAIRRLVQWVRKMTWQDRVRPVTYRDVEPARLSPEEEDRVRHSVGETVAQLMAVERKSHEVRQELLNTAMILLSRPEKERN